MAIKVFSFPHYITSAIKIDVVHAHHKIKFLPIGLNYCFEFKVVQTEQKYQ